MAIVDLSATLVELLPRLDIAFWAPTIADFRYGDLEAVPDNSIDVGLFSGMVRLSEQEHVARLMRAKCKTLLAFGACASLGGVPGLANMYSKEEIFRTVYFETRSTDNPDGVIPQTRHVADGKYELTLPEFGERVKPLREIVNVDYFIGGCPPHTSFVGQALRAVLEGDLPAPGSWITNGKAVCDTCDRNPAARGEKIEMIKEVRRTTNSVAAEGKCLLQQGYLCLGMVTLGDCGALCPKANVPCRGCGGPVPGVRDFGLRAIGAIAPLFEAEDLVSKIPDPIKLFYRYSLPASMLGGKVRTRG
jgi:F420-non-reducing hydrogenase small subunit